MFLSIKLLKFLPFKKLIVELISSLFSSSSSVLVALLITKSKVRKAPTYQERERYENEMRRNDEDYRSNKRHSSKVMRDDYYSEDFNKNKTRDDNRDYGN